jgi:archaellum component FlaC
VDQETVERLRAEMQSLLAELSDISARNDELVTAKEDDGRLVRELEGQVREYKKKYELAKTELRSVKGEWEKKQSSLFF